MNCPMIMLHYRTFHSVSLISLLKAGYRSGIVQSRLDGNQYCFITMLPGYSYPPGVERPVSPNLCLRNVICHGT